MGAKWPSSFADRKRRGYSHCLRGRRSRESRRNPQTTAGCGVHYGRAAAVCVPQALEKKPPNPVVPAQMMQRYASRTAAQKLGIGEGTTAALIDPPRNYATVIGQLLDGAALEETADAAPVTLWFVHDAPGCREALPAMRKLASRTKLWILWRKGSGVTQTFLREEASAVGLVDYKVCAVDTAWSAMLFARRKVR